MIAVDTTTGEGAGPGSVEPSTPPVPGGEWVGHSQVLVPEVTATLVARPDDPVTPDRILRRLDVLRQRLSVRWCGSSGAFAGYDQLEIVHRAALTAGTIQFTARLVEAGCRSHTVELFAMGIATQGHDGQDVGPQVLVRGRGRTLEINAEMSRDRHPECDAEDAARIQAGWLADRPQGGAVGHIAAGHASTVASRP